MTIGGKYIWKPDSNPPVGAYDIVSGLEITKPTVPAAFIKEPVGKSNKQEILPGPGQYDGHLTEFGHNSKLMTIGKKYVTKYNNNPAVGTYNPEPIKPRI